MVAWFDVDASGMRPSESLRHLHKHAVVISGAEEGPDGPLFAVRDSMLAHETRYTMPELNTLQLTVFTISPK